MSVENSFKFYKNCWLFDKKSDSKIFIKHIVYYQGTNEVKIYLFKNLNENEEVTFKYTAFMDFISNYTKNRKRKYLL